MFTKATKKQVKLKLAIDGTSGSGKTYSALRMASGMGSKIALIDTENKSASLYADNFSFDCCEIEAPFTPDKYIQAIKNAEQAGYDVLIIDSLSHAWSGTGGVLDIHDMKAKANKQQNSFAAWRDVTPIHNALVDAILQANIHVIATIRTKTSYEIVDDGSGKKKPVKMGLAPVQRDGIEYEFTCVFDVSVEGHIVTPAKDRTGLFDGKSFVVTEETGKELKAFLDSGEKVKTPAEKATDIFSKCKTQEDFTSAKTRCTKEGIWTAEVQKLAGEMFEKLFPVEKQFDGMTDEQIIESIALLVDTATKEAQFDTTKKQLVLEKRLSDSVYAALDTYRVQWRSKQKPQPVN